ncbi:MAG TPA: carboxypeptidase-like regulatory domain-containing protein [Candidatus Binatus sp.]|nr:carboxypeptidase-like regulatory domain-containing protein [Candidatus Binatus sp.]
MKAAAASKRFLLQLSGFALFTMLLVFPVRSRTATARQNQSSAPAQPPPAQTQTPAPDKKDKDKKSTDPATVKLRIEVTGADGKPVGNASVYVRFNEPGGLFHHEKLAELNFKTNQDGSVKVTDLPQGKILIQVVAKGWHTFGKWYEFNTDTETVQIKLDPPPHWY